MHSALEARDAIILLVEDNDADANLVLKSMGASKLDNTLMRVCSGIQALDYLYKRGEYADALTPDLILLDLNMPNMDGRELLEKIKGNPAFSSIPVIVLTTSNDHKDINHSYSNLANCFITKPVDFSKFIEVVQAIEYFWLRIAKLP